MPALTRIVVRDTPVDLLRDGRGVPLPFLHGAGAGGCWPDFSEDADDDETAGIGR